MWRFESTHKQKETQYLDQVIAQIESDTHLASHADSLLQATEHQEPLIAQSLKTPQDVRYHSEGSTMRYHLRLMLMFLFALVEERVHLIDIEEFRRLKGYEGEIDELEDLIKENFSFFQVFILCHDVAKWPVVTFSSQQGSKGEQLGFYTPRTHHFDDFAHERAQIREKYIALYDEFSKTTFKGSDQETQAQFYLMYGIGVHYPNHARKIHTPVFEDLLSRFATAHQLCDRDCAMLEVLISHHMEFGEDFSEERPSRIRRYVKLANKHGFDVDDFIDFAQACLLIDQVVGSRRLGPHGYWHDPSALINFLKSEHNFAPHRRVEKEQERLDKENKSRNRIFRLVGLDGVALMDLLNMEPGPDFGLVLRRIHAAILGRGEMPSFSKDISLEIQKRAGEYYKKTFVVGE